MIKIVILYTDGSWDIEYHETMDKVAWSVVNHGDHVYDWAIMEDTGEVG